MSRQALVPAALAEAAKKTGFSPAVRAGDFLFLTGATGGSADGAMPPDVATQTANALAKVQDILAAADLTEAAVVEITSYLADIDADFAAHEAVIRDTFSAPLPAWTAVGIAKLRRPGAVIEMRIVVHAPPAQATA